MNRRNFIKTTTTTLTALSLGAELQQSSPAEEKPKRKFKVCLAPSLIGLSADPQKLLAWASQFGFESVEPLTYFLSKASDSELQNYLDQMHGKKLSWGTAGLPLEFRGTDEAFAESIKSLPLYAKSLQRAGVTRVATWLTPGHKSLTYLANFKVHTRRLREAAHILQDHGVRLGLEYVGPKTAWASSRFPFIHTMAEMKDLIAEIGGDNIGFLLDSWHWYTAQETEADLLTLKNKDVVMCHLNDAPTGIPVTEQVDSHREMPCMTGVIDVKGFLGGLIKIGYEGPLACEPFRPELRKMPPEEAVATVAAAVKKAVQIAEEAV